MGRDLVPMWLTTAADERRAKAREIQRQIDNCKTEWWPSQLAVMRDAHTRAAEVYDAALAQARTTESSPGTLTDNAEIK